MKAITQEHNKINRRNFLKTMGAAALGSLCVKRDAYCAADDTQHEQVPKRKLGKTGVEVSSLGLGANKLDNQVILRKALDWGVTYWDTAHSYVGGNSELNIGKLLSKSPEVRKNLFITTKASWAKTTADMEKCLRTSLERMNTEYIDLYHGVHGLSSPSQLTDELKQWAESAKKRGLIRFFGFSTHENMPQCLTAAARLGWVDAIITSYNFRLMQSAEMQSAVETCHKAGVGLVAMKSVALTFKERRQLEAGKKIETEDDKKLLSHFLQKGFTEGQAKIKFVLENERISSACVGMNNVALLASNVAGVLDKTKLTQADRNVFAEYAATTCSGYCAGCAHICDSVLPGAPCVSDIARYLMYYNNYGDRDEAKKLFAQIPNNVRCKLLNTDYSLAEACCPQHIPIGKLIAEAVSKLA